MKWDFIDRDETLELDGAARRGAAGSFVRLSKGWTHYESSGPASGRAVVLVHGFSVPYFIWDPTFEALAAAGLRVTRYDLYGRGYSDRPRVDYDLRLFVGQLQELLDALGCQEVDLVGLSMGAAIAAACKLARESQVRRLVLIDPVGARAMPLGPLYKVASVAGISELVFALLGIKHMVRGIASDFFDPSEIELLQEKFKVQTQFKGFKRAIVSSLRQKMLGSFREVYEQLGRLHTAVMLIWGEDDRTVPFVQSKDLVALLPGVSFHAVANCGHIPHYEKPGSVNPRIIEFLTEA